MKFWRSVNFTLCLALACALSLSLPAHGAKQPDKAKQANNLTKHARKIERKLGHYKPGTPIHLVMGGGSDRYGTLGKLSPTSFSFTDGDSNAVETVQYSDVDSAQKGSAPIGEGSVHHHHHLPF